MKQMAEVAKRILVVKSKSSSFAVIEMYLKNRNWDVFPVTDLQEALNILVSYQTGFVLISVDLPHQQALLIPKIIAMNFPVCVMACSENPSVTSAQKLTQVGIEYKIFPPATGPAVERVAFKYLKDLQLQKKKNPELKSFDNIFTEERASLVFQQIKNGVAPHALFESSAVDESSSDWIPASAKKTLTPVVLEEGVKKVLLDLTHNEDNKFVTHLRIATKVACIVVDSPVLNGYLVVAMAGDMFLDSEWVNKIKNYLYDFLDNQGATFAEHDVLNIEIHSIEFEPWAHKYADFLRKSIHQGQELAMAFFPMSSSEMKVPVAQKDDMIPLLLKDLPGDVVVDFNLYLHLPANKKYILYTPKGAVFYEKQKQKLQNQGVDSLHLNKQDQKELAQLKAKTHLNESIQHYQKSLQRKVS